MNGVCSIKGCDTDGKLTRGWCVKHYNRWRAHGDPEYQRPTAADRFWAKVEVTDWCWLWTGKLSPDGYGYFWLDGTMQPAHRAAWKLLMGPIRDGLHVDHLCRVPACVNPNHLEPVPPRENTLRGEAPTAVNARKTHCDAGHELRPNPWGGRQCITCKNEKLRESRAAAREQVAS